MGELEEIIKYVDLAVTFVFIFVFAKVIMHLYKEIKRLNSLLTAKIEIYSSKLEIRDKENNENSERLRQSLDMLTNALINVSGLERRSSQRGNDHDQS